MARVVEWFRRARRHPTVERMIKNYLKGFLFLIIAAFLLNIPLFFSAITPKYYLYVVNSTVGVGTSLPAGAAGFSVQIIILLIAVAVALAAVFKAIRYFGIRL